MELIKPSELTLEELNLRDVFAKSALNAIIQSDPQLEACTAIADACKIELQEAVALSAYTYADSMLKVRRPDYKTNL